MFAGAAREAVFSKPAVIERIKQDFIPVALKAGKVANPPAGLEGDLYRELKRTQPAPQGICSVNSAGKVLAWSLMFEDDQSVLDFLDHVAGRYQAHPDGAVESERFMRFPRHQLAATPDNGIVHDLPASHAEGERCTGDLSPPKGWMRGRIIGRAIQADGTPVSDARTQDNYVEDVLELTPSLQRDLQRLKASAGQKAIRLPHEFGRLLSAHAYLGQLDVNPSAEAFQVDPATHVQDFQLWAKAASDGSLRVWGTTLAAARESKTGRATDGRKWDHRVSLNWDGRIEFSDDGKQLSKVILVATGEERLRWGSQRRFQENGPVPDVANLPAGRPIDFEGRVWYGLKAEHDSK